MGLNKPVTITIRADTPSKKNRYRVNKGGGLRVDRSAALIIEDMVMQAKLAAFEEGLWDLEHPNIRVEFHVSSRRADRDNLWVTLSDVLQKAGILVNDNVAHCNGTVVIAPAVVVKKGQEQVVIEFS